MACRKDSQLEADAVEPNTIAVARYAPARSAWILANQKQALMSARALSIMSVGYLILVVGTLKDGYIQKLPLPRIPRIQSASHMCHKHDTCYSEQVTGIPMWSDLV
jgi:hypothetical protein